MNNKLIIEIIDVSTRFNKLGGYKALGLGSAKQQDEIERVYEELVMLVDDHGEAAMRLAQCQCGFFTY